MFLSDKKAMFHDSLVKGRYNLLLGSGVCLDSKNSSDALLPSAESLCANLCAVTGAPTNTNLSRVAGLLNAEQKLEHLTKRFSGCHPGSSLGLLPKYLWRRLFTFNIDDVMEVLYDTCPNAKQKIVPLNFNAAFEPTPERSELLAIHLHGWVRHPETGYVFSPQEYARVMSSQNPWMLLLSEILATEPFIIAGTSLNEVDLEYYLSFRSEKTPRRDRGPSILVQPNPDVVTKNDCKRYGLELFPGTFSEFLAWLQSEVPAAPTVQELIAPDTTTLFNVAPSPRDSIVFFTDFELVRAAQVKLPDLPTGYLYGQKPGWTDIDAHLDIERDENTWLLNKIKQSLTTLGNNLKAIVVLDAAGTGKTTAVKRVVHDLVEEGVPVLSVSTTSRLDPEVAIRCLRKLTTPAVVLVDGIADHAEQTVQIFDDPEVRSKVVLLGTERNYRHDYLKVVFGPTDCTFCRLKQASYKMLGQLLERYRVYGLVGTSEAMQRPTDFVRKLTGDPLAVAICRIMNDFRPLADIIESLWKASSQTDRALYLCVTLAEYCVKSGLRYSLLQRIAGPRQPLTGLFKINAPLGLALNTTDDEYVTPLNSVIGEQILSRVTQQDRAAMMAAFTSLAASLAPHVNRQAIMKRSPEARLAGRMFDCDKVVRPFLCDSAEDFYVAVQPQWGWNSRYWEQRALLVAESNIEAAVKYARQAVAIEDHSFPLTTLGKILLKEMEAVPAKRDSAYAEAFSCLTQAIEREEGRSRVTMHPYATLLSGTTKYLELGGKLTQKQLDSIGEYLSEAIFQFSHDAQIASICGRLEEQI